MSDINDINNEYGQPLKDFQNQVFGNRPNEFVKNDPEAASRFLIEEMLKDIRTTMPGIVQKSFERDGAVWCEVQPGASAQLRDLSEFKLPVIRAPLVKMNIAGFILDIPDPVQGDEVAIVCADRSIGSFIKDAGVGVPETLSILNLNNAWILPVSFSNVKRKRIGDEDKLTLTYPGGSISVEQDKIIVTTSSETVEFTDSGVIVDGGTKNTARQDDPTLVNSVTDNVFITWIATVSAAINALAPGSITVIPTTVTGKVNDGTAKLKLPS